MSLDRRVPCRSQTVGPFFHFGLTTNTALGSLARPEAKGEHIRIRISRVGWRWRASPGRNDRTLASGRVRQGTITPADEQEQAPDPAFCGFGRLATDVDGCCVFETVRPGRVPDGHGRCQAAHVNVSIFARGLKDVSARAFTLKAIPPWRGSSARTRARAAALHAACPAPTLLKRVSGSFEIQLQGEQETVFFDI